MADENTHVRFQGPDNHGAQLGGNFGTVNNNFYHTGDTPDISADYREGPLIPSSNVPFRRDDDFVLREPLFDQIEQKCARPAARVALVGIGGVGKSQFAIEYCHRVRERSPCTWVFWVHASTTSRVEQGFREIAEDVQIPNRDEPQEDIFELVKKWLKKESNGQWFLVLDNVDDDTVLKLPPSVESSKTSKASAGQPRALLDYLPQSTNGAVLITTRSRIVSDLAVEFQDTIQVEPMTETEAVELLEKKLKTQADSADVERLTKILEFMPLAVVQAAAYINKKEPRCTVRKYIEDFERSDQMMTRLLKYEAGHLRRDKEAKNSVVVTWQISFSYIKERWPSSADLFSLMSFFDRQGIPEDVLTAQTSQAGEAQGGENCNETSMVATQEDFETDLEKLLDYSLVYVDANGKSFTMHRLVRVSIRTWLMQQEQATKFRMLFLEKLMTQFPFKQYENWPLCEALLPHAKAVEDQLMDHTTDDGILLRSAEILRRAVAYMYDRGRYIDAERMCRKSMQALELMTVQNEVELSSSREMLASVLSSRGQLVEAEQLHLQALEVRKRLLGLEHSSTLLSINNLATVYRDQSRNNEAEQLHSQVLEIKKRVLGLDHPSTILTMNNLALVYGALGRYREKEELGIQVLEADKRVLGPEHPSTLTSMGNLAITYTDLGRYKEAEELHRRAVEIEKRVLGPEHPDTLASIENLATTYTSSGREKEAEELEIQVLETIKRALGPDHPNVLTSINNLAVTYKDQGRYNEAEELQKQLLQTRKRVLGQEHIHTLDSMSNLASIYHAQQRFSEAEQLDLQALEVRKRVLGLEHPDTVLSMNNLAHAIANQNRLSEAIELLSDCCNLRKKILGPTHPWTLSSLKSLNDCQKLMKEAQSAASLTPEGTTAQPDASTQRDAGPETMHTEKELEKSDRSSKA